MRLRELPARRLHARVELLFTQTQQFRFQFRCALVSDIRRLHHITDRLTNVVLNGSFAAANENASRATSSPTPSISYNTRPGWISATQYSTEPLPLPCRTSSGFFVIGLSGNTRIQILPPRLTWRVIARRPASS